MGSAELPSRQSEGNRPFSENGHTFSGNDPASRELQTFEQRPVEKSVSQLVVSSGIVMRDFNRGLVLRDGETFDSKNTPDQIFYLTFLEVREVENELLKLSLGYESDLKPLVGEYVDVFLWASYAINRAGAEYIDKPSRIAQIGEEEQIWGGLRRKAGSMAMILEIMESEGISNGWNDSVLRSAEQLVPLVMNSVSVLGIDLVDFMNELRLKIEANKAKYNQETIGKHISKTQAVKECRDRFDFAQKNIQFNSPSVISADPNEGLIIGGSHYAYLNGTRGLGE